jgi:hypothetical protein
MHFVRVWTDSADDHCWAGACLSAAADDYTGLVSFGPIRMFYISFAERGRPSWWVR